MSAFTDASPATLVTKVARLAPLKPGVLDRVRHETLTVPSEWVAGYGEYQSGGWQTLSLYNDTRDPTGVTIRDCDAVETSLLRRMPATRALLCGLGLAYMWVRIARLRPNSFLWEHRDYGELSDRERYRLHIPLVSNSSAYLVTGGARVHLCAGSIWRIVPTDPHGACNLLGPDRVHLILDCYGNDAFAQLADRPQLTETDVIPAARCLGPGSRGGPGEGGHPRSTRLSRGRRAVAAAAVLLLRPARGLRLRPGRADVRLARSDAGSRGVACDEARGARAFLTHSERIASKGSP